MNCNNCGALISSPDLLKCEFCNGVIIRDQNFIQNEAKDFVKKNKTDDFIEIATLSFQSERYDDVIETVSNGLKSNNKCCEGWGLLALARAQTISISNFDKNFMSIELCLKQIDKLNKKKFFEYFNEIFDLLLNNFKKTLIEYVEKANKVYDAFYESEEAQEESSIYIQKCLDDIQKINNIFGNKKNKTLKSSIYTLATISYYEGDFDVTASSYYKEAKKNFDESYKKNSGYVINILNDMGLEVKDLITIPNSNTKQITSGFGKFFFNIIIIPICSFIIAIIADQPNLAFPLIFWSWVIIWIRNKSKKNKLERQAKAEEEKPNKIKENEKVSS